VKLVSGLLAVAVAGVVFGAVPAAAAPDQKCTQAGDVYRTDVPWAQRLLAPDQVWPLTRGAGQRVAIVGTGVDADNAQLAGRVTGGADVTGGKGTAAANSDCAGWGTVAAGIVAAAPDLAHTTFAGVAPGATIIPIRDADTVSSQNPPDPNAIARAIDAARTAGATVICVPVPAAGDSGALDTAVRRAVAAGAVVVSGVQATTGGADQATPTSYPTADAGVLGVGAVNAGGASVSTEGGDYIGVSAPGADLVSTAPVNGGGEGQVAKVNLPGLAAAFVAGVVALVRAYHRDLTPEQVIARVERTADRPPSGGHDPHLGWGTVDLSAAVSAAIPAGTGAPASAAAPPVARAAVPASHSGRLLPALLAVGGIVLAALLTLAATTLRRARARHFQPGRRAIES
jgi:membrane-anchored mycosin MYCP